MTEQRQTLGDYLAEVRDARGFSSPERVERDARERLGIQLNGRTLRAIESGASRKPEVETLRDIAQVYDIDANDLLERAGYYVPRPEGGPLVGPALTFRDVELIQLFHQAEEADREAALRILRLMARRASLPRDEATGG